MRIIRTCVYLTKLNIMREIERLSGMVSWGIMILVQSFSSIWLVATLVERFQDIAGWTIEQLIFMYGLGMLSHGLTFVFFIQTWWMEDYIIHGKFDRMLLRPLPVIVQFMFDNINFIGLFNVLSGVFIFAYGCKAVQFELTLTNFLHIGILVFAGICIEGSIYWILSCFSFLVKRAGEITKTYTVVSEKVATYPMEILPKWMQFIMSTILPYAYTAYIPAQKYFMNNGCLDWHVTFTALVIGIAFLGVANVLFIFGLAKYESVGA